MKNSWKEMAVSLTIYVTVPEESHDTELSTARKAERMARGILNAGISEVVPHPLWDVFYEMDDARSNTLL